MTKGTYSAYGIDLPDALQPAVVGARRRSKALRISDFCFIAAALAALGGMVLGIVMGISQDFTLAPAHAHLNLLGWVTLAIYGLYHRGAGRVSGLAGWVQVTSGALGAGMMAGGLALYLPTHDERFVPLVIAGSLLAVFGMLMFLGLVLYDWRQGKGAEGATTLSRWRGE
jgi:hypothetical protein